MHRIRNCSPEHQDSASLTLTRDQVTLWADRIASGQDEFPTDLLDPDRSALAHEVREKLRLRLMRLVARAIAKQLVSGPPKEGDPC